MGMKVVDDSEETWTDRWAGPIGVSLIIVLIFCLGLAAGRYLYFGESYLRDVAIGRYKTISKRECDKQKISIRVDKMIEYGESVAQLRHEARIAEESCPECPTCKGADLDIQKLGWLPWDGSKLNKITFTCDQPQDMLTVDVLYEDNEGAFVWIVCSNNQKEVQ